jgi:hypothetical protein
MPRQSLQARLLFDRIRCHGEGDGIGSAEPYLWTVFFKLDGDTVTLGDDLFLHGSATVIPTPGSHGNLGDDDVGQGDEIAIPSAIGELVTTLRPIPVPGWVTEAYGVEDVGGVIGAVAVLMEEDDGGHAGAEAGHAALDAFVRQALDGVVPSLGIARAKVTRHDADALTDGALEAIAEAIQAAQSSWEHFAGWLDADDQLGHAVFGFGHDELVAMARSGGRSFSQRWRSEGDWELAGRISAAPTCPAEAVLGVLRALALVDAQAERRMLEVIREMRRRSFAGNRELGAWWMLAQRNTACFAEVLHSDPALARGLVVPLVSTLAAIDPDAPLPESALVAMETLLQAFMDQGNRRLRIDAKAAVGVLAKLRGESLTGAAEVLANETPTRKRRRSPVRPTYMRLVQS